MMKVKFTATKGLEKALGLYLRDNKTSVLPPKLIEDIRKDYAKTAPIKIRTAILQDVNKGVSPVKGKRLKKYSKSYLAQIRGELDFRTVNGRVITIKAKKGEKLNTFPRQHGKGVSPVNLKVTQELHNALKVTTNRAYKPSLRFAVIVDWNHFLAHIHNNLGAGKSKVIRRLLPTGSGEQFNRTIDGVIYRELLSSVKKVVKRIT